MVEFIPMNVLILGSVEIFHHNLQTQKDEVALKFDGRIYPDERSDIGI